MANRDERGDAGTPRGNRLISRRAFRLFMAAHPGTAQDAETFARWYKVVEKADWRDFADVKASFRSADRVGPFIVFNVGGNKYRVVATLQYKVDKPAWVYIRQVLTHKEYDKGDWRGE